MKKNKIKKNVDTVLNTTEKKWFEKPLGILLLAVLSGLTVVYLAYYFAWNVPKEIKQQTQEQKQSAIPATDIPKKIPIIPPKKYQQIPYSRPSVSMNDVTTSDTDQEGIRIEGNIDIDMKNIKVKDAGGPGINIISTHTNSK